MILNRWKQKCADWCEFSGLWPTWARLSTQAGGLGGRRYGLCDNYQLQDLGGWKGRSQQKKDQPLWQLLETLGREGCGQRPFLSHLQAWFGRRSRGLTSEALGLTRAAPSARTRQGTVWPCEEATYPDTWEWSVACSVLCRAGVGVLGDSPGPVSDTNACT